MAGARIQSYAYSEGPSAVGAAAPATAKYQGVQTLAVIEQAYPADTTYARPSTATLWDDLLVSWGVSLSSAYPMGGHAGHYAITYSTTTQRVTIASTNGVAFRPVMVGQGNVYLGFTQDLSSAAGWATTWTGASAPRGVVELVGLTVKPAEDGAKVTLTRYRHGRGVATGWGNTYVHHVTIWMRAEDGITGNLNKGWCVTGRVRFYQGATLTAYSPTNLAGYLDGYVVNASGLKAYGTSEDFLTMDLTIATGRTP